MQFYGTVLVRAIGLFVLMLVPHSQAYRMIEVLSDAGVPSRVELLVGAGHGWGGQELERTRRSTFEFFAEQLQGAN
jgi:hypothetical protein